MALNQTMRTWVSGETVTAAEMNTEIRDALTGVQAAWTSYTPTLTNITLGNGTVAAASIRYGKSITVRCMFQAGSTTTYAAGALGFSVPVTAHTTYTSTGGGYAVGSAMVQPGAAATRFPAVAAFTTGGILNFTVANGAAAATATNLVPSTFGTSGQIAWTVTYEAA